MSTIKTDTIVDLSREAAAVTPNSIGTEYLVEGTAKAWAQYNQATPAVVDSFNVTSATDSSAGQFVLNLTAAMSDANYSAQLTAGLNNYGASATLAASTSGFRTWAYGGTTLTDVASSTLVMGTLA